MSAMTERDVTMTRPIDMTTTSATQIPPIASDDDERRWQLVLDHDRSHDGAFVYAVR